MTTRNWGILGSGNIVRRWIRGARQTEGLNLCAIGSRDPEHARKTAEELGIPKSGSYLNLVQDPEIEICYVAVPHPFHLELAKLAMSHGKHVLVEKPAAVNAAQWAEMTACAQENHVFLMEAVWTRFFPAITALRELLTPARLGALKALFCSFSYFTPDARRESRNLSPALAGGGLLDVGVYCLHLCDALFGEAPETLTGFAAIDSDQNRFAVDEQAIMQAVYPGGRMASMACGVRTTMPDTAVLCTQTASIEVPHFWKPTELRISQKEGFDVTTETKCFPVVQRTGLPEDEGFRFELQHVHACLAQGLCQSPEVSWATTARVLSQCDQLRAQWGLRYPFE